jgi:hypothetical protein
MSKDKSSRRVERGGGGINPSQPSLDLRSPFRPPMAPSLVSGHRHEPRPAAVADDPQGRHRAQELRRENDASGRTH